MSVERIEVLLTEKCPDCGSSQIASHIMNCDYKICMECNTTWNKNNRMKFNKFKRDGDKNTAAAYWEM